jgi:Tfp pilus assembly protein PilO
MATNPTSLNTPYLFLTGVILIAVVFLFVVMQPMMDNANTIRHTIAADQETLKDKEKFLSSLDAKMQQLQALADVERQMAAVLPESERNQDVLRVVYEYATQAGITIVSVANNSPTSDAQANAARARGEVGQVPDGVKTLAFDLGISGSYEQLRLFLTLLGRSPRVIDVAGLSLKGVTAQPGQVTATLMLQLYSQQKPQVAGT